MSTLKKLLLLSFVSLTLLSCGNKTTSSKSIAVFVPGIMADSPIYDMLAKGVTQAVDNYNADKSENEKATLYIMEAGTNQAEWGTKLLSIASTQQYDVIISSNPSLPDLVLPILEQFPEQKFLLLDAEMEGNENVYTIRYNQSEQAFLTGCISGLMSESKKIALVAAQEYPVMNNIIYPYFVKGAEYGAKLDNGKEIKAASFMVVGNWYDANKAAVISDSLIADGFDILSPICGGAAQGVINSAVNNGIYVSWFDNNGFEKAPGTIISSSVMKQFEMSNIVTTDYLNNKTKWASAEMVGLKEGFVEFVQDDPLYIETIPEDKRALMAEVVNGIKNGTLDF